ncbi:MAG: MotA/TolQ/ExbB proton channel family protein [Cyanobacteria bacterium CAN_BIN43]|nr:MotA/TolQ/ExbB proton channel family protein [Cyanobacteria bacterium CAN_BIN43]
MSNLYEFLKTGGPTMIPMAGLSIMALACGFERAGFWYRLLTKEDKIVRGVLEAAHYDLAEARAIAEREKDLPIGRFLVAPLKLKQATPETFRLAMEAAADKEFIQMRKGDKLLETVIAVAPLLGLLGTVTGLIATFANLNIGGGGGGDQATKAAAGIGEALLTTAAGMIVAIVALVIFRALVTLQSNQMDYFSEVGSELELIYRQEWYEPSQDPSDHLPAASPVAAIGAER